MTKVFMKLLTRCLAAAALLAILPGQTICRAQMFFEGFSEESAIFVIHPDGSCSYTNVNAEPRATAEQQVRMTERFESTSEDSDENPPAATASKENEAKPLTDEELIKKLESMKEDNEDDTSNSGEQFNVILTNGTVRMETTRSFASLRDMLAEGASLWQGATIFQSARFEQDSNEQIRVTLTAPQQIRQFAKNARAGMKLTGLKAEFRLMLPGKVLTSGLPETEGNATGFSLDAKKDESLDAMMKLYDAPVVITAEAGGLKISEPLDSKALWRASRGRGDMSSDLPIVDAGSGFLAEPETITTTTIHFFPGGENYFKEGSQYLVRQTGAVVTAKIFAPKGRTLQSVSDVRVLKATDDKGRDVAPVQNEDEEQRVYSTYSTGDRPADSTSIQLALQLPAPDAQAINELDGEAVAVTAGSWSEMSLTNLQENATNEIDLSTVLPGAKLVIKKLTSKNHQNSAQLEITGPRTIQRLDFKAKIPGAGQQMNSSVIERHFATKAGVSTRTISIEASAYGDEEATGPMFIVVRYPQDLRRERVQFKLTALDLL